MQTELGMYISKYHSDFYTFTEQDIERLEASNADGIASTRSDVQPIIRINKWSVVGEVNWNSQLL